MKRKINVNGKIMYETSEGERFINPDIEKKDRDLYGWHKIHINGKVMWGSPEGERSF